MTSTMPALDRVLTAGRGRYTVAEAAVRAGVDPKWAERIWRAAGFEGSLLDQELSDDDVGVLGAVAGLLRDEKLAGDEVLRVARACNLAVAPLAESAAGWLHQRRKDGHDLRLEDFDASVELFEQVILHAWRRRLLMSAVPGGVDFARREEGIGFADVVGFTTLVRRSTTDWLTVLDRLEAVTFEVVASQGGRVVKTIGDEVMFVHPEPGGTVAICADLLSLSHLGEIPRLRVGAAWGQTTTLRGDRFGEPVNLASRLVRATRPGEALLCPELRSRTSVRAGMPRRFKGIGWRRPGRLRPTTTS